MFKVKPGAFCLHGRTALLLFWLIMRNFLTKGPEADREQCEKHTWNRRHTGDTISTWKRGTLPTRIQRQCMLMAQNLRVLYPTHARKLYRLTVWGNNHPHLAEGCILHTYEELLWRNEFKKICNKLPTRPIQECLKYYEPFLTTPNVRKQRTITNPTKDSLPRRA